MGPAPPIHLLRLLVPPHATAYKVITSGQQERKGGGQGKQGSKQKAVGKAPGASNNGVSKKRRKVEGTPYDPVMYV
eukprot:7723995-Pyramimonas_sp.AAC.2